MACRFYLARIKPASRRSSTFSTESSQPEEARTPAPEASAPSSLPQVPTSPATVSLTACTTGTMPYRHAWAKSWACRDVPGDVPLVSSESSLHAGASVQDASQARRSALLHQEPPIHSSRAILWS